jgi:hypothetical protein
MKLMAGVHKRYTMGTQGTHYVHLCTWGFTLAAGSSRRWLLCSGACQCTQDEVDCWRV